MSLDDCPIQVSVNGTPLSSAQVTSLYLAVQHFRTDLQERGLGREEHDRKLSAQYLARLDEVKELMQLSTDGEAQADSRRIG